MSQFLYLLENANTSGTIILYLAIFITASWLMMLAQKKRKWANVYEFRTIPFICSFIVLWIFFAFNDIGVDTPMYRGLYERYYSISSASNEYAAVEKGYQYLNVILHIFTENGHTGVILIRSIQLSILYASLYLLKDKIIMGYGIMAYIALYYFQSFDLLRSSLAGVICLLSFALTYKNKRIIGFILALLALSIHQSSILFIFTLIIYYISSYFKKYTNTILIISSLAMVALLSIGRFLITTFLANDFGGGRYDSYDVDSTSVGLFVFIEYLPVIYMLIKYKTHIRTIKDLRWWNLCFIFAVAGFSIAILAYSSGMLTRAAIYFSSSFIFFFPSVIKQYPNLFYKLDSRISKVIYEVYYMFLFIITISGIYEPDGIIPFKFI